MRDDPSPTWRPFALRPPTLLLTTLAILALLGLTTYLSNQSHKNGAVFFVSQGMDLSLIELFEVRYLPTVLVVLVGMWIAVVDLDVKRLEPWYQLSAIKSANSASALFCRYDTAFVGIVLIQAFLKRHWQVLSSCILIIIVTVVLPAVQNSMFSVQDQHVVQVFNATGQAPLASLDAQILQHTTNFMLTSYAMVWLGLSSPPFTTKEYALAPFGVKSKAEDRNWDADGATTSVIRLGSDAMLTSQSTRYWTELSCWAPASIMINYTKSTVSLDDGKGCFAKDMISFNQTFLETYTPKAEYEYEAYSYGTAGGSSLYTNYTGGDSFHGSSLVTSCPESSNLFLITYRLAGSSMPDFAQGGNATAMFCKSSYFSEPVNATIRVSNMSVKSYTATGPQEILSNDNFNISRFELMITSGGRPDEEIFGDNLTMIMDVPEVDPIDQQSRINNLSIITPMSSYALTPLGTALGITGRPTDHYLDPDVLVDAFTRAHQLLFAQSIAQCFVSVGTTSTNPTNARLASVDTTQVVFQTSTEQVARIVPGFAIATQVLLGISACLCLVLLATQAGRPLHLQRNPDTLAELMRLSRSAETQRAFSGLHTGTEKDLDTALKHSTARLDERNGLLIKHSHDNVLVAHGFGTDIKHERSEALPKHLLELSWGTSGIVIALVLAGTIILSMLFYAVHAQHGVAVPGKSDFEQQFLLNFLPTTAATLLGVYMSLLCRSFSFIQPMQDLASGHARPERTLLIKYTSLPPHLLFLPALRARHFLLSSISVMALLGNVLTVTTASIFTQQQVDAISAVNLGVHPILDFTDTNADLKSGVFDQDVGTYDDDARFLVTANLTNDLNLPSWTTKGYAFAPLDLLATSTLNQTSGYQFRHSGYGGELECVDFFEPGPSVQTSFDLMENGTTYQLWANFTLNDGSLLSCGLNRSFYMDMGYQDLGQLHDSVSAIEISDLMWLWNETFTEGTADYGSCSQKIVKGWVRGRRDSPSDPEASPTVNHNATIVLCEGKLMTQDFQLNVSTTGDILSSSPIAPATPVLSPSKVLAASFNNSLIVASDPTTPMFWHNETSTIARDYSNYFYATLMKSRKWLNASMPLPTVDEAIPLVNEVFARLFTSQVFLNRNRLNFTNSSTSDLSSRDVVPLTQSKPIQATATIPTRRLFISLPNFIITLTILTLDLIVLVYFRLTLPKAFLPRMPFTIASQIAFFADSHVIDDVVGKEGRRLEDYRYGYGRFVGKSGKVRVGIEREGFVYGLEGFEKGSKRSRWWRWNGS